MRTRGAVHLAIDSRMVRHSGIGTYLRNLIPRIVAARPDWRFTLLGDPALLTGLAAARGENATIVECRSRIYTVREQLELARKIPRSATLVWAPHYNAPLLTTKPLVVTIHDICHVAHPEFAPGLLKRAYANGMLRMVCRKAELIICDSHFTARELRRHVPGLRTPVRVIHLGVGSEWSEPRTLRTLHDRPYFLFVGNVKPAKNLGTLLDAYAKVMDVLPHGLVIVGRNEGMIGPDAAVLETAGRWPDRVHLTGEVSDGDLHDYVRGAAALVFPSRYEGFGLPPLEAMAAGCPCIVSSAASLPEVCGSAPLYFDPDSPEELAERLIELASDEALRGTLVKHGRAQAAKYDWDGAAASTTKTFEAALDLGAHSV